MLHCRFKNNVDRGSLFSSRILLPVIEDLLTPFVQTLTNKVIITILFDKHFMKLLRHTMADLDIKHNTMTRNFFFIF